MAKFASGKKSKAISDISGFEVRYTQLKTTWDNLRVEPEEYSPKHPQLTPAKNVVDATALFNPRPDNDPENVEISIGFTNNPFLSRLARSQTSVGIPAFGRLGSHSIFIQQDATPTATGVEGVTAIGLYGNELEVNEVGVAGTGAVEGFGVSGDGNLFLEVTGVSGVGGVGTVGEEVSESIVTETGLAGTGAIGTEALELSITEVGVAGTGAIGTISQETSITEVGVAGTGAIGTESVENDRIFNQTGVAGTGAVGNETMFVGVDIDVTGVAGTGNTGTESIRIDFTITETGVAGTGTIGADVPQASITETGVSGSGAIGTEGMELNVVETGVAGTGTTGAETFELTLTETGVAGTGAIGTEGVRADSVITETGIAGTGAVEAFGVSGNGNIQINVTGTSGVAGTGTTGNEVSSSIVTETGVAGTGAIGTLTLNQDISFTSGWGINAWNSGVWSGADDTMGVGAKGSVGSVESNLTLTDTFTANQTIGNANFTRTAPVVFACEIVLPKVVDEACTLFEMGGNGHGMTVGFTTTDTFRLAFGRGNNDIPTNDKTIIDIPKTSLPDDGLLHTLVWEANPTNGSGKVFIDDVLVGSADANPSWSNSIWAGTDSGGFISQLDQDSPAYQFIRAKAVGDEPNVRWDYGFSGGLRHYESQSIADRRFDIETNKTETGVAGTGAIGTSTPATNIGWNEGAWNTGTWGN